jgi:hypothetical protein
MMYLPHWVTILTACIFGLMGMWMWVLLKPGVKRASTDGIPEATVDVKNDVFLSHAGVFLSQCRLVIVWLVTHRLPCRPAKKGLCGPSSSILLPALLQHPCVPGRNQPAGASGACLSESTYVAGRVSSSPLQVGRNPAKAMDHAMEGCPVGRSLAPIKVAVVPLTLASSSTFGWRHDGVTWLVAVLRHTGAKTAHLVFFPTWHQRSDNVGCARQAMWLKSVAHARASS